MIIKFVSRLNCIYIVYQKLVYINRIKYSQFSFLLFRIYSCLLLNVYYLFFSGVLYMPLVCRKCGKRRAERREIITEIVETEEKYGRDLRILLDEFYRPMLVAGLLSQVLPQKC